MHLQQTLCGGTLKTFAEELWLTCTTQRKGGTVLNALHRFAQQILSVCHMSNHFHTFPSHVGVSENGVHPKNMMCLIGKWWSIVGFEGTLMGSLFPDKPIVGFVSSVGKFKAPPSWSQLSLWQGRGVEPPLACQMCWALGGQLGADCLGIGSSLQVAVHLLSGTHVTVIWNTC